MEIGSRPFPIELTAGGFLIGAILAITFAIAQLGLGNAFGRSIGAATRAQEFIVGACDGRAIGLVTFVCTVVIAVTMEVGGDAKRVCTAELSHMASREI